MASLAATGCLPCSFTSPLHSLVFVVVLAFVDHANSLRHPAGREKGRQRLHRRVSRDVHRLQNSIAILSISTEFVSPPVVTPCVRHARASETHGTSHANKNGKGERRKGEGNGQVSRPLQGDVGSFDASAHREENSVRTRWHNERSRAAGVKVSSHCHTGGYTDSTASLPYEPCRAFATVAPRTHTPL